MPSEPTSHSSDASKNAVREFLRSRSKKAFFLTEVFATLQRAKLTVEEVERALAELETERAIMIRDHFCADPHLEGVDLRIVALITHAEGVDPQVNAIREIDSAWDQWLSSYLANHRCG
jgi:hypothetical protein